jgi:transposase, IS30 family
VRQLDWIVVVARCVLASRYFNRQVKGVAMVYTHLTRMERYQIFSLIEAGHKPPFIAAQLSRHPSTIYRELKRNLVFDPKITGYSPSRADSLARSRVLIRSRTKRISEATWLLVIARLRLRYSPEQISGDLAHRGLAGISHERIYQHIWADKRSSGTLWTCLRGRLRRGRRYRVNRQRGQIVGRIGIEQRPPIANERRRCGDYEIDTVFGKGRKSPLVTMVDRCSRFLVVKQVASKHAIGVARALVTGLRNTGRPVHTITSDNGKEFALHRQVSAALNAQFYFARPYASWERGTNENTNGLLRQYFPKDCDFSTITQEAIDLAVNELNHRPRKTLGFKSPHEVFFA